MPVQQIPLIKGSGKNFHDADYVDLLPVNMLATPKQVLDSNGYMRSVPGIDKRLDVTGVSRGSQWNTSENAAYRVLGGKLYRSAVQVGDVPGSERVSMACSYVSQAVAASGTLRLYGYDGAVKTLSNWPSSVVQEEGYTRTVKEWTHKPGNTDFITFAEIDLDGLITITLTPKSAAGVTGTPLTITETQWGIQLSQLNPGENKPYITGLVAKGTKGKNTKLTIDYTFNANLAATPEGGTPPTDDQKTDASVFTAVQTVEEVKIDYAQYEIGSVRDVVRARGRYVWAKDGTDTFGITDLEDESHPDQYSPFYRAESQPDGIMGLGVWRDFVVAFGTSTIEYFSLTGSTTAGSAIYVAQPAYMVQKGIAGTHCKTPFADSFAFISNQANGAPSVYVISSGQASPIATAAVEKILRSYSASDLGSAVMETLRFDSHELLIIHLPRHVLCYDAAASQNGPQWCILKTGNYDDTYRGIDFLYEGNEITCGDKLDAMTGQLNFASSAQYAEPQEHLLYTPMIKADGARLFDLELESSTGVAQMAERIFYSASADGINFGQEQLVPWNAPFRYDQRTVWRRIGRVRKNISFKFRIITSAPVTLSGCAVRVE